MMQPTISNEELSRLIKQLPTLPKVIVDLANSLGQDDTSTQSLAQKIQLDPVLTAKTLRLANSSIFGVPRQITSIEEAVQIIGLRSLKSIVLAIGITGTFERKPDTFLDIKQFWRHSIATASCSQAIAEEVGASQEMAFVTGLLHDIGRLGISACLPEAYEKVAQYRQTNDCSLGEAERACLGLCHAAVGAQMLEHWGIPAEIEAGVAQHVQPDLKHGVTLGSICHLADMIVHGLDLVADEQEGVPPVDLLLWESFRLTDDQFFRIFQRTESEVTALSSMLEPKDD